MERVVLHCDLNAFYASVELLEHPELKNRPVAVCGDPETRHGIVLAKNEPAKACGIKTAETIWQARRKCPELVILPAHHDKYAHYSRLAGEIYRRYTDLVEPFGIDESWLDMTGSLHLFGGDGKAVADEIRAVMKRELGLTVSVGVSFNKVFAKLGSDYKKPDATTVISRENFRKIVWPLPVGDLLFAGKVSSQVLARHGIRTVGDLAAASRDSMVRLLGKGGGQLYDFAVGEEHSPVRPAGQRPLPKSVGNGLTFPQNLTARQEIRNGVVLLSDRVGARLRRYGLKCTTVQITLRDPSFQDVSRQKKAEAPTFLSREIARLAMELIDACHSPGTPVRAITITAAGLIPQQEAGEQLNLFCPGIEQKTQKLEQLEKTMDTLRGKYGKKIIGYAANSAPNPVLREGEAARGENTGKNR